MEAWLGSKGNKTRSSMWLIGCASCLRSSCISILKDDSAGDAAGVESRHDAEPLTPESAKTLYVYENFLGFLDSFKAVSARLKGPDDYELITYNMIETGGAGGGACRGVCLLRDYLLLEAG